MLVVKQHTYVGTKFGLTDEELSEANINQMAYHPDWLSGMVERGKISETNKQQILQITEALESTYPGLWDIQVSKSKWEYDILFENISGYGAREFRQERVFHKLNFDIIIKFPEIVIKNSSDKSHTIRDLYVKFQYKQVAQNIIINSAETPLSYLDDHPEIMLHDGFYQPFKNFTIGSQIHGLRETLTEKEYRSNYHHSHLSSSPDMRWTQFCLGSGEIGQTLLLLESGFTIDLFQMALYQLEAYVAWESIEGRPYNYIRSINEVSGTPLTRLISISSNTIESFLCNVRNHWNYYGLVPILNWKITNNKFELIQDEQVDTFLRIYSTGRNYNRRGLVYYQDSEGRYYDASTYSVPRFTDPDNVTRNTIVFRGEVRGFRLIQIQEDTIVTSTLIFHPKIKETLKQKLEAYGNNARIREGIAQRANQIILIRRASKQNQISMSQNQ